MMEKKQLNIFKVRDLRKKDQFKIDDLYLNGYARVCGANATLVYNSLCRHAGFHTQEAFPSQAKIAYEHKIAIRTVRKGLKKLIEYNIVFVKQERIKGKFINYIYVLLDKSEWKKLTIGTKQPTVNHRHQTVGRLAAYGTVPTKDNKELRITNIKDNKDSSVSQADKEPFSYKTYLEELIKNKRKDLHIIGLYWQQKGFDFTNRLQCSSAIKRELRPAKNLIGYSDERIVIVMKHLKGNADFKWVLETVHKYIDEDLNILKKKDWIPPAYKSFPKEYLTT